MGPGSSPENEAHPPHWELPILMEFNKLVAENRAASPLHTHRPLQISSLYYL